VPVAVLIVNYRSYDALSRCLASLADQLAPGDEVVVVDHESDRPRLADALKACPGAIAAPGADNAGFAAGVNRAARLSRAEYLLLVNPDTVFMPATPVVRGLEAWLEAHADTGVVGPRILNTDGTVQPSARRFPGWATAFGGRTTWLTRNFPDNWLTRRDLVGRDATASADVDWMSGACLMTPRRVFDQLGGLDESFFLYWEDADYGYRLAAAGLRRTFLPALVVRHAGGASAAADRPRAIRTFHRSAYTLHCKHAGLLGRLAAPVVGAALWLRGERLARQAFRRDTRRR
jgi:GT2 family glycosyltransferase